METLFGQWLQKTRELQRDVYGTDPATLHGEKLAEFVRWNVLAAEHELHEFLDHVQYKPWSTRQGEVRDLDGAREELVDVLHFVANLAVAMGMTDEELNNLYRGKMDVNRQRQVEGYDSFGKAERA